MAGRDSRTPQSTNAGSTGPRSRGSRAGSGDITGGQSSRVFWVLVLFLVFALLLIVRMVYLTVVVSDEYSNDAIESRTVSIEVSARRGTIYDRNGNVLACSVDATTIYCVPQEVTDPQGTATILAALLQKDEKTLEETLSNTNTTFAYIDRKERVETAQHVADLNLPGIYFLEDSRREYPYGEAGGTVIGFLNVDDEGVSGLEAQYDSILSGVNGTERIELGVNGTPITGGERETTEAVNGQDIMVSIDIDLQIQLESSLKTWAENLEVDTQAMVMDATTGEIYAAGSTPLLNPSNTTDIEEGATELTLVSSAYEPGSIFKTVAALSALESGTVAVEDEIDCPSQIEADGYYVSDSHARGDVTYTFREVIQYSSNVGISLITERTGFDKLYQRILEYGLNEETGVDYPGEATGYLLNFDNWSKIQGYNVSFGQGISVTPVQMTRLYASLLNNGVAVTPHFLIAYPQSNERVEYPTKEIIHSQKTIEDMTSMLKSVVSDGTAKAAQIDGFEPAGKTGTAEIANPEGGYYTDKYNISFVGFLPDTNSNLVCFTGAIEQPAEGNVSGLFKDIMTYAIDRYSIVHK